MKKFVCVFALLLFVFGCSKSTEVTKDVTVSNDGYSVKIDSEGVKVASGEFAELPKGFPEDVYVYENAKLISVAEVPNGYALNMESSDSQNLIIEKYKKEMTNKGWNLQNSMSAGDKKISMFNKQNRMATLMLDVSENKTVIAITSISE